MALGLASCCLALNATALTCGASSWANLVNQSLPHNLALSSLGVTRKATAIPCFVDPTAAFHTDPRLRLLLVSGLDGSRDSVHATLELANWFTRSAAAAELRSHCVISVVPCVNMDGLAENLGTRNGVGGDPSRGYPPSLKSAYHTPTDPERSYLWRWIGMHAPDLVLEVRTTPQDLSLIHISEPTRPY